MAWDSRIIDSIIRRKNNGTYISFYYCNVYLDDWGVCIKQKQGFDFDDVSSFFDLFGGFATDLLPHDLIQDSGLLGLGNAVIGVIIVHLGTMMSFKDLKLQWKTFVVGSLTVVLMTVILIFIGELIFDRNIAVAGTASITGGTLSILMVQEKVNEIQNAGGDLGILSSYLLAVFPLLILNLKNLVGFLFTANILKKEALRVK